MARTDPGRDPDAGKNGRQKEKGVVEDEMRLDGTTDSVGMTLNKLWGESGGQRKPGVLQLMESQSCGTV